MATHIAGIATTANGKRQPYDSPKNPAIACPQTIPSVIDSPVTALIFVRSLGGNKSDIKEYVNGAAPPTAIPVSARNQYN